MRTLLRWLLRILYRFDAHNVAALATPGPVLLLPNHVSWWDWLLIGACLEDDWRFVTSSNAAEMSWLHKRVMINRRTIPVDINSPFAVKRMAEYLQKGGRLVLFPEGRLSCTGSLMKLFDGTGFLIFRTRAKVITAFIRGAERLPLSRTPGRKRWFPRVSVHFSEVLTPPSLEHVSATAARARLTDWLRDQMLSQRFATEMEFGPATLPEAIAETARQRPRQVILQDYTLQELTYRHLLVGADLLAGQWRSLITPEPRASGGVGQRTDLSPLTPSLSPSEGERVPFRAGEGTSAGSPEFHGSGSLKLPSDPGQRVGVLLPNVNAMPVVILSLWAAGKVPAILNYSIGTSILLACAKLAGLKHVITSRAFIERTKLAPGPFKEAGIELLFLEDMRARITSLQRFLALLRQSWKPHLSTLNHPLSTNDPAVILFTSGSEGDPKGVELTHRNLLANIRQMVSVIDLMDTDRVFNALPLFHSFGLSVGLLLPLVRGVFILLYPSPLHYRVVPSAFYNLDCTIFFGTNTFLNGYARKAHPYDFRTLRHLFAGAEKVQEATAALWMQKFGVRILEGYGATECSPCLSVNLPMRPCHGSAGRFLPGIEHRLEPVEGVSEGGRLFVRGPNIMRGYLNPEANAKFQALDGWYDTGDIVSIDPDGFLFILGRLKRFAKVSGEMVSLAAVEDALAGAFPQYGLRFAVAVVARSDAARGEKLIAVTNEPRLTMEEVRAAINARGLNNLAAPREIKVVHDLPRLGTGKINHRELEKMV
jgi:acyl-[acyl-carrier-protein]-phospholipid O-acyltransferase/long-chain-fatty-acid--[acyl-carrier-protein] ligase